MTSIFLQPPGGDHVTALGSTYRFLTPGTPVEATYSLMEEEFWGDVTPLHSHPGAEESFYVLDGEVEVWVDGVVSTAGRGSFIVVPRGVAHALRRVSPDVVRMLTVASPPGLERIFPVVEAIGEEELLADPERLVALAREHGTEVMGDHPSVDTSR